MLKEIGGYCAKLKVGVQFLYPSELPETIMDADQEIREHQREYLDFLDDEVTLHVAVVWSSF